MRTNPILEAYNSFEGMLEFPYLKNGTIGVQVGFDLSSKNLTSDLFIMSKRVGPKGLAIGIDPDIKNIEKAKKTISELGIKNIKLIHLGTYKEKTTLRLNIAPRSSHNVLAVYDGPEKLDYAEIEVDRLDDILLGLEIDIHKIRHINITNNGAEYHTLLGLSKLLPEFKNISITLASGRERTPSLGIIDGKKDKDIIIETLKEYNFNAKFYRIRDLFWWGFYKKLIIKQSWVYDSDPRFGVVVSYKGNQPFKFFHSYLG